MPPFVGFGLYGARAACLQRKASWTRISAFASIASSGEYVTAFQEWSVDESKCVDLLSILDDRTGACFITDSGRSIDFHLLGKPQTKEYR